ncbi:MAG: WYL domain-containing protein [Prevotellaceae bacterium]|jgi:hypothetical protein|nr:WYL domain-containing protein [Prevotellaceae bacterium]
MVQDVFKRHTWLVNTIYEAGKISFEELNERWLRSSVGDGKPMPLRTFHNSRIAIEEMFDLNIECDKRDGYRYYIEDAEDVQLNGIRMWLLNTFAVNNLINESHKLKSRILFEDIPSGEKFLAPIIEAMHKSSLLEICYQSFSKAQPSTFEVAPYCVKVFRQRWYVVAHSPAIDKIMVYALDRIQSLRTTGNKFKLPKDFDGAAFFDSCYGVIAGDQTAPETVLVKVFGNQINYLRTLPMHHSQKEVEEEKSHVIFEYYVKPTYDFVQAILSLGSSAEVLAPQSLRTHIRKMVKEMGRMYAAKIAEPK